MEAIAALERLKSAACAAQADLAVGLDASVREQHAVAGVAAARRGRGVGAQVALARSESPHRGQVLLGFAKDLATDLPHTRQALREGVLNEYRAVLVARETGCLDREDRARLDEELCAPRPDGGPRKVEGLGTARLVGELRRRCYALDPASVVRRHRRAETERRVSIRPAPDAMAYLTGLLPMAPAISAHVALGKEADRLRSAGDPRSRGQLMADLMVARLTGLPDVAGEGPVVPVCLDLVMSDTTAFGAGHDAATIPGHGPVPAQIARELAARATQAMQAWVRRLYTDPSGNLVALTTKQRLATDGLATYLALRDQGLCRTPWCDAPARHSDHIHPGRRRWSHHRREHPRTLRGLRPHQTGPRLDPDRHPRHRRSSRTAHRRDHHPHRPPTPITRARTTGRGRWCGCLTRRGP